MIHIGTPTVLWLPRNRGDLPVKRTISSVSSSCLLSPLAGRPTAVRAVKAGLLDNDTVEALDAAPPAHAHVAALVPLVADLDAAALDVLTVVLADVVAEVVLALEGVGAAWALGVVAVDEGQVGRVVDVVLVALEIGSALELGVTLVAADRNIR